ncbi:CHRD domain-containing protein [Massilia sp. DD77]|uniref:CHRD domain-containing protein n=1 Tax=Massilia sp. DD77 TaxID=3109349 RepID=UPI0030001CF9
MKKVLSALALAASTLALAPSALAVDFYRAVSSGPAEATPNPSPGYSIASFELDGMILSADIPFTDLVSGTTMAHIHCCTVESLTGTAGVAIPLFGFPTGVTSGNYSQTFDLADPAVYDPAFLTAFGGTAAGASAALLDALGENTAYLNIHTTQYPGGEIRGFMVAAPIPEPGSWAMLGVGLLGVGAIARRRMGQAS